MSMGTTRMVMFFKLLFVLPALATTLVQAQMLAELARYDGADRTARLIAGAQKEGMLQFYTTIPPEYLKPLTEEFEKKYGVKVDVWRARSEAVLQRVMAEAKGGRWTVDVVESISPPMEALYREKLTQEVRSPEHKNLIDGVLPAHREWAPTLVFIFVQAYNTAKVKKEELPKTYEDLLDPKWKGRLSIEASDHEWFYSVLRDMDQKRGTGSGLKFFQQLVTGNGLSTRVGHPLLVNLVASGEVPLALTVYQYSPEQLKKKGAPIDWFAIEPAVAISDGMAVMKNAPHPHAALLFYDYLLSEEGNKQIARIGYAPANRNLESPLSKIKVKVLNPATLLDESASSSALFDEVIIKRSK
jgi:iron(III) transport system substrate-binding protein